MHLGKAQSQAAFAQGDSIMNAIIFSRIFSKPFLLQAPEKNFKQA